MYLILSYLICVSMCVGSAYLYYSSDGVSGWSQVVKIVASDGVAYDYFGVSVSMYGNMLAVGAYYDDTYRGDVPVCLPKIYINIRII